MSTPVIRYIPEDPGYVASPAAIEIARAMLEQALGAPTIATVTDAPTFVDPGQNLDIIRCPACGEEVDLGWWQERMAKSGEGGFAHLEVAMPCCGAQTTLHDLDYDRPAGFARLVLEVQGPQAEPDEAVDEAALERVLGCVVRRVEARY